MTTKPFQGLKLASVALAALLGSGCAAIQGQKLQSFDAQLQVGDMAGATAFAVEKSDVDEETKKAADLLWTLQAATVMRNSGSFQESTKFFDDAEILMYQEDTTGMLEEATGTVGTILVNDTILDYHHAVYEGIMVNTYKAVNFLLEDDFQNARVEFNRADERQRRAAEAFAERIAERKEEMEEERQKNEEDTDGTEPASTESIFAQSSEAFAEQGIDMSGWEAYEGYVNPAAAYIHGLFFRVHAQGASDLNKAKESFERAYGISGNAYAKADLVETTRLLNGKTSDDSQVWVVFENGLVTKKESQDFILPAFIVSDHLNVVTVSLPRLVEREPAYPSLLINDTQTETIADMDRIVKGEFKEEFPYIVAREVIRATFKAAAQVEIQRRAGPMAGLLASAVQIATTGADVRMMTSLPKEFQVAKLDRPTDGKVQIKAQGLQEDILVELKPDTKNAIIFVRSFSSQHKPIVNVHEI